MYKIRVHQYYYQETLNAPQETSWYVDEYGDITTFKTKKEAEAFLSSWLSPDTETTWKHAGRYNLSHGEYSSPVFELVKVN